MPTRGSAVATPGSVARRRRRSVSDWSSLKTRDRGFGSESVSRLTTGPSRRCGRTLLERAATAGVGSTPSRRSRALHALPACGRNWLPGGQRSPQSASSSAGQLQRVHEELTAVGEVSVPSLFGGCGRGVWLRQHVLGCRRAESGGNRAQTPARVSRRTRPQLAAARSPPCSHQSRGRTCALPPRGQFWTIGLARAAGDSGDSRLGSRANPLGASNLATRPVSSRSCRRIIAPCGAAVASSGRRQDFGDGRSSRVQAAAPLHFFRRGAEFSDGCDRAM
jgi:hypothetical protein